ncbi:MAG: sulfite exporter TauE/SafE family protein [Proteobacteria bacterium]|nr:sulfite exporter TauE/SafE family protein [Pseudomonadota bacterium]MBU4471254.1 sulfite exporter TauE/SafE family protein [Pseudomonadota bacterium]MCG2752855.1 sulfite exporter TauE/SafE family protein [Desulfobacteraceae bacterium]
MTSILDLNLITILSTFLVVFIGGFIQGTVAFGMGIFMVVSLAWLLPSLVLMPFTTLVSGVNLSELARRRRIPLRSFFAPVLVFPMILGVYLGTWLLVHLPDWGIKLALGMVIFLTGVIFTIRPPKPRLDGNHINNENWEPWSLTKAAVIFLGGILGGWLSVAGPPVILYGYATMPSEAAQRFLIRVFLLSAFIKIFTYGYAGLWTAQVVLSAGVCVIFVLISTAIGHRLATSLSAERLNRMAWIVFTVMGFLLFVRTLINVV